MSFYVNLIQQSPQIVVKQPPSGKALGSFSPGSFSIVANIAIIEKDPSEKDPNAIGRFAAHKNPKLFKIPFGGREAAPKRVFC